MSQLKQIERLRPFQTSLVSQYFVSKFKRRAPKSIVELCVLYCFVLDEFISKHNSWIINGINNTIIALIIPGYVLGHNIISLRSTGKHHWSFKIEITEPSANINFGFIDNRNKFHASKSIWPGMDLLHIYLDLDNKIIVYKMNDYLNYFDMKQLGLFLHETDPSYTNKIINLRIAIDIKIMRAYHNHNRGTIELIEYHDSNWYTERIWKNTNDAQAYIGYAQCCYDNDEKVTFYSMALQNQYSNKWNKELLKLLSKQRNINPQNSKLLSKSTLSITFNNKPLGCTLYRGENDLNAWVADIRDDNIVCIINYFVHIFFACFIFCVYFVVYLVYITGIDDRFIFTYCE